MMTTQRFEPIDFAHDRGPLHAMRRDALAVHAIGDEMTHLMRDGVEQKVIGVLIQLAFNLRGMAAAVAYPRRLKASWARSKRRWK